MRSKNAPKCQTQRGILVSYVKHFPETLSASTTSSYCKYILLAKKATVIFPSAIFTSITTPL